MTHCDIGISASMAYVLGENPTIDYLCGNYDGGSSIRDSLIDIELDGRLPAAVDCPACQKVASLVYYGKALKAARKEARKLLVRAEEE